MYYVKCYNLKNILEKYFKCSSFNELFENVDATTIMDFIKETNFYYHVYSACCFRFHFTVAIVSLVLFKLFSHLYYHVIYLIVYNATLIFYADQST